MLHAMMRPLRTVCCAVVLLAVIAAIGCSTKTVQYKEDHDRIVRIDAAVEGLRRAYAERDKSEFDKLLLESGNLDLLQRDVQNDFDAFREITLEFAIERIMIEGEAVDVFVHWQGQWKRDASDAGIRQRGHARLQWVGVQSILLRDVEGDLPFGMHSRAAALESAGTRK